MQMDSTLTGCDDEREVVDLVSRHRKKHVDQTAVLPAALDVQRVPLMCDRVHQVQPERRSVERPQVEPPLVPRLDQRDPLLLSR